jgi:hypothetical protein
MTEKKPILRASGQQVTGLKKAKQDQEQVPRRGTRQLTAIERARLKKS